MPATKLKQFLDDHQIRYVSIRHSPAYTAQEIAASAHISGREVAKPVMVKLDDSMAMAVLRATDMLDLQRLRQLAACKKAVLASEDEFARMFPDCEAGAMPALGNLYGLPVYVDRALARDEHIAFNAGTHAELIQMDYEDFHRLVQPTVADLASRVPVTV